VKILKATFFFLENNICKITLIYIKFTLYLKKKKKKVVDFQSLVFGFIFLCFTLNSVITNVVQATNIK
jgi:hypothetical protein